ncbi:uracil-DNA glycosylase [Deefgea tanakiae]|uniref:Uracil-DNA glycosylase n=1 Tax=Deefgea tanakiae TaxID=2865840 RepID=A0ABX8Z9X2_9NEIS|nr:uracil-DNA glycosylase [Deefgea tanakiae]QZA79381.1 uracil-DNA glycosylase [Deefgea tanakiae]
MNRRAVILQELGLNPQWIRHEVLAAIEAEEANTAVVPHHIKPEATTPVNDPHFSPIANAVHHRIEEQIAESEQKNSSSKAAAAHLLLQKNKTTSGSEKRLSTDDIFRNDARSECISQMSWEELRVEIASCTACPRHQQREQAVFGTGQSDAQLFIVSDAPSKAEEQANLAIVGPAQRMLSQMLISLGQQPASFMSNAVKCCGPRNPTSKELAACAPLLQRQIALVKPKAIFAIGQFAAEVTLNTPAPIRELRGKAQQCQDIPTFVSYHPSYLQRNLHDKAKAWQDLLQLKTELNR